MALADEDKDVKKMKDLPSEAKKEVIDFIFASMVKALNDLDSLSEEQIEVLAAGGEIEISSELARELGIPTHLLENQEELKERYSL